MSSMSSHHFLSYSSVDADEFALQLTDELEAGPPRFQVWIDKRNISAGENWDDEIVEGIRTCDSLIFVMTTDSVEEGSICKEEWALALRYKKPVIPIRLHNDADLPFRLGSRQYIDFTGEHRTGLAQLRLKLRSLASPQGKKEEIEHLLRDAKRDLRRASTDAEKQRIQDDIALLEQQKEQQQEIIDNPKAVEKRVQESIESGLERERQPERPSRGTISSKFINPPPVAVPHYFQDRQIESKMIGDFLKDETSRLMTVVGRAGTGKTALVCRVLKALEGGQLPDNGGPLTVNGIVYLSTIGARTINVPNIYADLSKLLPAETANQLDALYKTPRLSTETKMRALLEALPSGRTVLLLDNFEDMLDPEGSISDKELDDVLNAVLNVPQHGLKVIITTRVPPSALASLQPARQMPLNLDEGLIAPYAENILREMDADSKVGLKSAPESLLNKARELTRGYPRALEALYAILSTDHTTSLEDVVSNTGELPPEKVVQALVGEAFSRLDPSTQQVMQALAVFERPVAHVAVDYLLQPYVPGVNSAPILNRLVGMKLAHKEAGRYSLHPVDREYAFSRIPKGEGVDRYEWVALRFTRTALQHRAADYFEQVRKPREEWKTIEDLGPQLAEFDLRYACEDYDTAARVLVEIHDYLYLWGFYGLSAEMCERLQGKPYEPWLKRYIVGMLGHAYYGMGRSQKAISCYEQALIMEREATDRQGEGICLGGLGNCYAALGQTAHAIDYYEQALAIFREIGYRRDEGTALNDLGYCYAVLGQTAHAIDYHEQALAISRETEDQWGETSGLGDLANALYDQGRYAEAIQYALECVKICEEIGKPGSYAHTRLAQAHFGVGDLDKARAAIEAARRFDVPRNNHTVLGLLGLIAFRQEDRTAAQEAFAAAVTQADMLLAANPQNYEALNTKGFALCGLTLCEGKSHVRAAIEAYRASRAINRDAGNVLSSLRYFDELALADTEGLLTEVRTVVAEE